MSTIKNDKNRFLLIFARLKEVSGKSKDKEIAEILGFDKDTFGARKSRGSVPEKEIKLACADNGWSVAYIEEGTEPRYNNQGKPEVVIPEKNLTSAQDINKLRVVVDEWPNLPDNVKRKIVSLAMSGEVDNESVQTADGVATQVVTSRPMGFRKVNKRVQIPGQSPSLKRQPVPQCAPG